MIYLDNAATSLPKPPAVARATAAAIQRYGNPGRSGHRASLEAGETIFACRQEMAALLGADDPLRFVFCANCTDALNEAIKGMLPDGGHVVLTALEHNSALRPLFTLEARGAVTLTVVQPRPDGYIDPDDYEAALRADTRLAVVNHASNVTGAVQPVLEFAARCYRKGVPILVDGAQSVGCVPLDLSQCHIDLLAFPGHKGLLGPQGSGALFVRSSCAPRPLREGGTGSASLLMTQPPDLPELYESGTQATPAIAGLAEGTRYVRRHFDAIVQREDTLTAELWEGLSSVGGVVLYGPPPGKPRVGVVSFNIADLDASACADWLSGERDIACRAGLHCAPLAHRFLGTAERGALRFSVGPFTTSEDIRAAVRAVHHLATKGL